jgi:hypothetical protein
VAKKAITPQPIHTQVSAVSVSVSIIPTPRSERCVVSSGWRSSQRILLPERRTAQRQEPRTSTPFSWRSPITMACRCNPNIFFTKVPGVCYSTSTGNGICDRHHVLEFFQNAGKKKGHPNGRPSFFMTCVGFRQLRHVGRDPPRLVLSEQFG